MSTPLSLRLEQLAGAGRVRILAFGSSNTERILPGIHWLDCVQFGFGAKFGLVGHFINTGIGGNTSADLLKRFETDAAVFRPHVTFLTVAGNDCNPDKNVSAEDFEANLRELHRRFEKLGTHVIFQTYYAPDSDGTEYFQSFYQYSDIVRAVAADTGSSLIDNLARWMPLREKYPELYAPLMRDAMHLNERGNKVYGFDIAHSLGCPVVTENNEAYWAEPVRLHALMDELASVQTDR